ncbi:MmpS family transport accessory protein [Mycobacterium bourgelatii]|nr:MmpS family transport accessory protein [Mycobacterium bourgelatii]MCV6974196.1 hypothetical protein [Mycobacterium bourgelatii]
MTTRLLTPAMLLALGIGFVGTCGAASAIPDPPKVRYEVSGGGMAEYITYQTRNGQTKLANVPLPWSTELQGFWAQQYVLSAQGQGTIACRILLDGTLVNDAHSTGTPGRTICTHS